MGRSKKEKYVFVAGFVSVCSASVLCTRPCFCVLFLCAFWSYHWYDTDPSFGLSCGVQMYAGFCRVTLKCSGDEFKRPCSFRILRQCVHQFDFGRVLHLVNVFQLNGLPQTIERAPPTWNDVCGILSLVDSCSRMCLLPDKRWWFSSMTIWESFSAGFEGCGVLEFVF